MADTIRAHELGFTPAREAALRAAKEAKRGGAKPAEATPAYEHRPARYEAADPQPAEPKPAEPKPAAAAAKPAEAKPSEAKPAAKKSPSDFNKAFAAAWKSGATDFTHNGKKYSTKRADGKVSPKSSKAAAETANYERARVDSDWEERQKAKDKEDARYAERASAMKGASTIHSSDNSVVRSGDGSAVRTRSDAERAAGDNPPFANGGKVTSGGVRFPKR